MERCRLRAHFSVQYNIAGLTSACRAFIAKLAIEGPYVFVLHWPTGARLLVTAGAAHRSTGSVCIRSV
jgi:hypothetical protein